MVDARQFLNTAFPREVIILTSDLDFSEFFDHQSQNSDINEFVCFFLNPDIKVMFLTSNQLKSHFYEFFKF